MRSSSKIQSAETWQRQRGRLSPSIHQSRQHYVEGGEYCHAPMLSLSNIQSAETWQRGRRNQILGDLLVYTYRASPRANVVSHTAWFVPCYRESIVKHRCIQLRIRNKRRTHAGAFTIHQSRQHCVEREEYSHAMIPPSSIIHFLTHGWGAFAIPDTQNTASTICDLRHTTKYQRGFILFMYFLLN